MSYIAITILVLGAVFVASRLVRLAHLFDVLRSVTPDQQAAEARMRASELAGGLEDDGNETEAVGVAIALALREAENEARGKEMDGPV